MEHIIQNQQFDQERALYHLQNTLVRDCVFAGPADGESAFKEARNIGAENWPKTVSVPWKSA